MSHMHRHTQTQTVSLIHYRKINFPAKELRWWRTFELKKHSETDWRKISENLDDSKLSYVYVLLRNFIQNHFMSTFFTFPPKSFDKFVDSFKFYDLSSSILIKESSIVNVISNWSIHFLMLIKKNLYCFYVCCLDGLQLNLLIVLCKNVEMVRSWLKFMSCSLGIFCSYCIVLL